MLENLDKNSITYKELSIFSKARSRRKIEENTFNKLIIECEEFELDLDQSKIKWIISSETSIEYFCQIVGTRTNDGQFMWAWGHPSVPGKSRKAAEKVQIFGNKHNLIKLIDRRSIVSICEAENFSNIAALLDDADGTWSGNYGDGRVYLIYYNNLQEVES